MPTLDWIGKDKVINHHMDVPYRVLDPQYTYGEDTGNMIIHGDNLEALKSLLPQYEGKIRCIYIDPPYNTGTSTDKNKAWVYSDNVDDPRIRKWLGQVVGSVGEDLSRDDKWLCMMYPRLKLLHRLLADDGFIFISIDVFEYANLRYLLDEIFGSNNFRNCIAVRRGIKNVQAQFESVQALSLGHEYIYLYSKTPEAKLPKLSKDFEIEKAGKWDTFWRGTDRPTMRYEIFGVTPDKGQWRWEIGRATKAANNYQYYLEHYSETMSIDDFFIEHLMATNEKLDFVRKNDSGTIQYYVPPQTGKLLSDNWMDILLSGSYAGFDTEKNVQILDRIIGWISDKDSIILDSFAGSGTTAHSVINQNNKDGGNRRYILIEMCDYADTITAERVRRVLNEYSTGNDATEITRNGFTFYELGENLLDSEYLNENVPLDKIRSYVYFTETKQPVTNKEDELHYLGSYLETAYYFYYDKDAATTLDHAFLTTVKTKAESYVIYADRCILSEEELEKYHITFKKIPRDITRL